MKKFKVPVNEPYLYGNENKYLQKCIRDGFHISYYVAY